jgi:hypothetical protein
MRFNVFHFIGGGGFAVVGGVKKLKMTKESVRVLS